VSLRLRWSTPGDSNRMHLQPDVPAIFGRDAGCDGRVDDPNVSRRHVRFTWRSTSAELEVEDLGTANGTWLNGELLTQRRVPVPVTLWLGPSTRVHVAMHENSRRKRLWLLSIGILLLGVLALQEPSGDDATNRGHDNPLAPSLPALTSLPQVTAREAFELADVWVDQATVVPGARGLAARAYHLAATATAPMAVTAAHVAGGAHGRPRGGCTRTCLA